mgnify:FL=1
MKPRHPAPIAEREYWLVTKEGERRTVRLRIYPPVADGESFHSTVVVDGLGDEYHGGRAKRAWGEDSVQALYMALQHGFIDLACTSAYREGRLTLEGSPNLALPTVTTVKHIVKVTSWVRVTLGEHSKNVLATLARLMRNHLTTFPDDALQLRLASLAKNGHDTLPFPSKEAATSFRDDVRGDGIQCEHWDPPTSAML